MSKYEDIKNIVAAMQEDVEKFDRGNFSAGTRIRKDLQALKKAAQAFRDDIQERKKAAG